MKEILFTKDEVDMIITALSCHYGCEEKYAKKIIGKLERAQKTIKVSSRKAKGRNLQYWVCERLAEMYKVPFEQNNPDCEIHSREMGQHGTDIVLRGKVRELFPFSIECKCQENIQLPQWIEQARKNVEKDKSWLLVLKKQNIGSPVVVMDWRDFEKIMLVYN